MAENNSFDLSKLYNFAAPDFTEEAYNGFPGLDNYYQNGDKNLVNRENVAQKVQSTSVDNNMQERNIIRQRNSQMVPTETMQNAVKPQQEYNNKIEIIDKVDQNKMQNLNDLMKTQVGKKIAIQFLVGNDNLIEKKGTVLTVGDDYIILNEEETGNTLVCDFYNIRFASLNY